MGSGQGELLVFSPLLVWDGLMLASQYICVDSILSLHRISILAGWAQALDLASA
jgi:hypothetical protein